MPIINEVFAFIATEEDGEGIPAAQIGGNWFPLIAADRARVDSLRDIAQDISNRTGVTITLARFTVREDMETITPRALQ